MIIKYLFKHTKDGDLQSKEFTLDEIEQGKALEYKYFMKKDGYKLINRWFEKYI